MVTLPDIIVCNDNEVKINSYVLKKGEFSVVIDPNNFEEISKVIDKTKLEYIFVTHEHFDHILGVDKLREKYGAKVIAQQKASLNFGSSSKNMSKFSELIYKFMKANKIVNRGEVIIKPADTVFDDKFILNWHGLEFKFFHTPGHSDGSCVIILDKLLFAGDSLFSGYVEPFFLNSKCKKIYESVSVPFFKSLDRNLLVKPGHFKEFLLSEKFQ